MIGKTESEIIKNWKGDKAIPLVSICCTTYNHEKFISEALDSFLIQETDFPFEIIIRDDASIDKTKIIIEKYYKRFPKIIKPILEEENTYSKGVKPITTVIGLTPLEENTYSKGVKPMTVVIDSSNSDFIALCEGDDYFIDSKKLQRQYEVLQNNNEISLCFHNVNSIENSCEKEAELVVDSSIETRLFTLKDLISGNPRIATSSMFFRKSMLDRPDWFDKVVAGEKKIQYLLANKGLVRYLPQVMSVYRKHISGMSYQYTALDAFRNYRQLFYYFNIYTDKKYIYFIFKRLLILRLRIIKNHIKRMF